jgi:Cof subfamily protein (haloacid dehalogenase superfamily)
MGSDVRGKEVGNLIKIVFFDVDGTLKDRDYLPESTKRAIGELKAEGVLPVLCTGRSEFEMAALREELGIDWAITCNGSHIGFRGRTVHGKSFSREMVAEWLETAKRKEHTLLLYGAEKMFINRPDCGYFRQAQAEIGFREPLPLPPADEIPDIYQCIVFCGEEEESAYTGNYRDELYLHRWRTWATDINPGGMNKSVGIRTLLNHMGYTPEEAAAFGDGLNDMEMIGYVGMGIAMGNACEELLQNARYVTRKLRDDGILYGVREFILS